MTLQYHPNDEIYIPQQGPSLLSMSYYAEHSKEITCPCKYRNLKAIVVKTQGNFVYVRIPTENIITAFHVSDIRLINKGSYDD